MTVRTACAGVLALALGFALACARAKAPTPPAPPGAGAQQAARPPENVIRWATASELDNFGFDVYRAELAEGPFTRINEVTIEGGGTTDEVRRYRFVDREIDPRKRYFYYVESISMSGVRERFTPVAEAGPKIPQE